MVNMAKTNSTTQSAQWKVVYDRLEKLEVGEIVPYVELQALLPDTEWKGVVTAFHQARKRFEGIDFENVRGEGYRKVKVAGKPKQRERSVAKEPVVETPAKTTAPVKAVKTVKPQAKAPAVAFVGADTGVSKVTKLTDRQRIEALETQVEFLNARLAELDTRAARVTTTARRVR